MSLERQPKQSQQAPGERCAPAAVIIDGRRQFLYAHGPVDQYLTGARGVGTLNLLELARKGLRASLRAAIAEAARTSRPAAAAARVRRGSRSVPIRVTVSPLGASEQSEGLLLVTFEDCGLPSRRGGGKTPSGHDHRHLLDELKVAREELQAALARAEAAHQELRVVKDRLQEKADELERINDDLANLLTSTNVPTVFLDRELRVRRITPAVAELIGLLPTDVGRPLEDVLSRFPDNSLLEDCRAVLDGLASVATEVRTDRGKWFLRRIGPYRTGADRVEGAVLTFLDVDELKKTQAALEQSLTEAARLASFPLLNPNPIAETDLEGRVLFVNPSAHDLMPDLEEQGTSHPWLADWSEVIQTFRQGGEKVHNREVEAAGRWYHQTLSYVEGIGRIRVYGVDITDCKRAETYRMLQARVLHVLNQGGGLRSLAVELLQAIRVTTGFDAAALRLRSGEDFPYFQQDGYPEEFLQEESSLCEVGPDGEILRDEEGRTVLACTCGAVLRGRTDPAMSCFTPAGSFWTNLSSSLLDLPPEADPRLRPRNRCIHAGYQSVGLFPIRSGREIVGLLQLNDRRAGRFSPELIAGLEALSQNIGLAIERASAQETLRESEERLRLLVEHAPVALAMFDREMRYMSASRRWLASYDLEGREVIGVCHYDLLPDLPERYREAHRRGLAGEVVTSEEDPFQRADGSVQWARWEVHPWHDAAGEVAGIVIFVDDVTERRRADEALRESEQRFRALFEGHGAPMILLDPDTGDIIDANEAAASFYGYSRDRLRSMRIEQINQLPPHEVAAARRRVVEEKRTHFIFPHRLADGQVRWVEVCSSPVTVQGRTLLFSIIHDITARRRAEERLLATSAELERSNKDLEQFAYIAGHDLQEPLRMVSGFMQLLADRYRGRLDEKGAEYVAYAVDGAKRMHQLIEDLLAYSRVDRSATTPVPIDANDALATALANLRLSIQEAGATVTADELPVVRADPTQLAQVFQNLIGNAVKFRRPGVPAAVHVSVRGGPGQFVFAVRDNGLGIPPDQFDRIFQVFRRLHTRESYPGTGIGLAIVRRIVERHGGKVWVESAPGEGSTFFFEMPGVEGGEA